MANPKRIQKLDESVVNRIAAGEIIQRPSNALKELIENSLDAKSTSIQVLTKEGGLKLLQIQDNGVGININDLDILCERFTTSKLQNFDDLKSISTYGFRGEALASISHIAKLTVTTKTVNGKCAYRALYIDSKLVGPPVPCAGNQGTIITVENLFYNVATRRKALSAPSEEFAKITEVVMKYAVHNPNVGFTLKKHGETITHVRTPISSTKINNIRLLYGNQVAKELLEIELNDNVYRFKLHALITNANYSSKRLTLLLFINHRLVDSNPIKKTIQDLYNVFLPKKAHPWCYISLEIDSQNVDVNLHPTKHEVRFLHEDTIIEKIKNTLHEKLIANDASRTFYIQSKLPKVDITKEDMEDILPKTQKLTDNENKIQPKDMIRTNSLDQKLDKFNFTSKIEYKDNVASVSKEQNRQSINKSSVTVLQVEPNFSNDSIDVLETKDINKSEYVENDVFKTQKGSNQITEKSKNSLNSSKLVNDEKININCSEIKPLIDFKSYSVNEIRIETKLLSVLTLRKEVEETYHQGLREVLSKLIFVGCIDEYAALIQCGVSLYICNTQKLVEELFYEIMLYDFANYGVIKFSEPLLIQDLAMLGLDCEEAGWSQDIGDKEELAVRVQELLLEKSDMLRQYFSIYIDKKGYLKSLPILLENYFPNQGELPLYLLRLSTEVNWSKEKPCFHDICRETARFYSKIDVSNESWKNVTENILYSAIKESLLPPKHFLFDSTILEITNLPNLYKVFERC